MVRMKVKHPRCKRPECGVLIPTYRSSGLCSVHTPRPPYRRDPAIERMNNIVAEMMLAHAQRR